MVKEYRPRMTEEQYSVWKILRDGNFDVRDLETLASKQKTIQKQSDLLRISRKLNRELIREENALEELGLKIVDGLSRMGFHMPTKAYPSKSKFGGVFHLTDTHFNELIRLIDDVGNEYDFEIASKRMKKFVSEAVRVFKTYEVTDVLFAMTGDMLNSDRRTDELLSKATDKASAYLLALDIISQMILELNLNGFNIYIATVSGNESRFNLEFSQADFALTENWDYLIHQSLKKIYKDKDGIHFVDCALAGDVVEFYGTKFFLTHGEEITGGSKQKKVQEINGKQYFKGKPFDYCLCGHYHSAQISDTYARGGSPAGGNVYSDKTLNLRGKASQNIHIVEDKTIHSMKIDIQKYGDEMYEYDKSFEAYNSKSYSKIHKKETIIKIVV